jgi:hypothetical protein
LSGSAKFSSGRNLDSTTPSSLSKSGAKRGGQTRLIALYGKVLLDDGKEIEGFPIDVTIFG